MLEHPNASVSAEVVITLLERAERSADEVHAITVLADRAPARRHLDSRDCSADRL
jgi:hypothetical protein